MALVFSDIQTRVMNMLRLPTSNTSQATQVGYILNEVYRDILARNPNWWFLQKKMVFNTATGLEGVAATVVNGSVTVTLTTAPGSEYQSFMGRAMFVGNATDNSTAYRVAVHATGSASIELDAAYVGASTTSASLNIYKDRYDAPADFGRPRYLQRFGYSNRVEPCGPEEMATLKGYDTSTGAPQHITMEDFRTVGDMTDRRQIVLHPYPDIPYRCELAYQQTSNAEVSGETRFYIPDDYAQVLVYGALARAYPAMLDDSERGLYYQNLFNDLVALMVATQRKWEGNPQMVPRDHYRQFYRRGRRHGFQDFDREPRG